MRKPILDNKSGESITPETKPFKSLISLIFLLSLRVDKLSAIKTEFHGGSSSESPLGKLAISQQLRGAKNLRGGQSIERERTSVRMSQEVQAAVL
ncbi:hypothetical protein QTP88_029327 [Uroleucon formosanum]